MNKKESASFFNFHSAPKPTILTKISENKGFNSITFASKPIIPTKKSENKAFSTSNTSTPKYSQLTTSPSSNSCILKSTATKSVVMALSKIQNKRKPLPTRSSLTSEESSSLFNFYHVSEPLTTKHNTEISVPTCITPSSLSTTRDHSTPDHDTIPKEQSKSTEHEKTMDITAQSAQLNVTPITTAQLITHMETTSSVTTTRNVLKVIAAITSKKSKKPSITNTKPITSYYSTQDHSSDTVYLLWNSS